MIQAVLALSPSPTGFTTSEVATRIGGILKDEHYSASRAAYELRELRCKSFVSKILHTPRYQVEARALRAMAALLLLAAASRTEAGAQPRTISALNVLYRAVHQPMRDLFSTLGMAA